MTTGRRQRFNIRVTIQRGDHAPYSYMFNRQPVRPGKVDEVFAEAIADVMGNVTRGGRHEHNGWVMTGGDIYIGVSGGIVVEIKRENA